MQPLRGYDSLAIGDLLPGIAPAPLSHPNMPGPWDADPDAASLMAAQINQIPRRQSGITRDSLRALKQAMARIAPHVPPRVLQQHYIRRLAELSNPTPGTLHPIPPYDTPLQTGDPLTRIQPAPLSPPSMPSAMDSPFVRAAMARLATSPAANGQIQSVRADDAPLSSGDLTSGIRPAPLSPPNMPDVMDSPFVRRAMARLTTSPATLGHVQPARAYDAPTPIDLRGSIDRTPPGSSALARGVVNQSPAPKKYPNANDNSDTSNEGSDWRDWLPIYGPAHALYRDYENGDPWSGAVDGILLATDLVPGGLLLKAPAWAVAKGLAKGVAKGISKESLEREVGKEWGKIWKSGSNKWKDTKAWILRNYPLPANTHVHHAFIAQKKGKAEPKWLINQWWNLVPLKDWKKFGFKDSQEMHWAIDGKKGKVFSENPFTNDYYRMIYAYPKWAKIAAASGAENILANDLKLGQMISDHLYGDESKSATTGQKASNGQ